MATIEVTVPAGVDAATAKRMFEQMLESQSRVARVRDALARESAAVGPGTLAQIGRLDRAWRAIEAEYGLYTAAEVTLLTGTAFRAGRSHVHNLRRRHGLLGVRRGGALVYPGFQFTTGNVVHVRRDWQNLTAPLLTAGWTEDEVLLWFAAPTGLLSGEVPVAVLDEDPDRVHHAVSQAAAGTVG